ncbi:MAG: hypothetical protein IM613_12820 [Cytophagales bacterium]|nr:hypothetical protein [Cytophagales bacterium]
MEAGTRQIVQALKQRIGSIRDLPRIVALLWRFGLNSEQRELAKQSLRAYVMSQVIGETKRKRDIEEVDRILNNNNNA